MKLVPSLLLSLIVKNKEGSRGTTGPEPERLTPLIRTASRKDKVAAPQDGPRFCAPLLQGIGTPCIRRIGYLLGWGAGFRSPASSSGASTISASAATGGSTARTTTASAEASASADNASGGFEAAAAPAISLGTTAASTEESASGAHPTATCASCALCLEAHCVGASLPARPGAALAIEADAVLRTFRGARPVEPCLRLLGGKGKAGSGHTKKEPGQKYPQILTHSEPRPIVPSGRPLEPWPPRAPPRFAPLPASAPSLPRAPGAPKGRFAHAQTRRPKDQPPVLPARATALQGQAGRPDSPGSPQPPRPRGQVPPQPAPILQTGTLMPRPWILTAPAHSGAGSTTPGRAADLG
jgi:hypothetical protein